jgi:hypothetical protein
MIVLIPLEHLMHTAVITCAFMFNLSMQTQLDMSRIFPSIRDFCIANPTGVVTAQYRMRVPKGAR